MKNYNKKLSFTPPLRAQGFSRGCKNLTKSEKGRTKPAFTLAETLITLVIVGIVAALTIPNLIIKHQKEEIVTRLKKVYSTLNQIILQSNADNGKAINFIEPGSDRDEILTKTFFEQYWFRYFKINKISPTSEHMYKNEFAAYRPWKYLNENVIGFAVYTNYNAGRVIFSDTSGMVYYIDIESGGKYKSYQTIIIDINGLKKPNMYGKDVFWFVADLNNNVVQPIGYNYTKADINSNCSKNANGIYCAAKIMKDGWKIADDYPW